MQTIELILKNALQENKLTMADATAEQKLVHYLELMQKWNRVFNLTTITQPRQMVYLHIIDSLIISPYLHGTRLLDIGTGAGLPGLPLAIMHKDQQWTLLDKNNKKTRFLIQVIAELGLTNVNVIHGRSEEFHPGPCFDSILSRALGTLRLFVDTSKHLLCKEGTFIAMKGHYPKNELSDIPDYVEVQEVTRLNMQGMNIERHIVRLVLN